MRGARSCLALSAVIALGITSAIAEAPRCGDDAASSARCAPVKGCIGDDTRFEGYIVSGDVEHARIRFETGADCVVTIAPDAAGDRRLSGACDRVNGRAHELVGFVDRDPDQDDGSHRAFSVVAYAAPGIRVEDGPRELFLGWYRVGANADDAGALDYPDPCWRLLG